MHKYYQYNPADLVNIVDGFNPLETVFYNFFISIILQSKS
jgi:hypothetical protein